MVPVIAVGGLLAAACGGDDDAADAGGASAGEADSSVVVTTSIWADVVENATCAEDAGIEVVTLIPANADPHDFEPSLQDRETLDGAELVVANGLDLEASYADLLSTAEGDRLLEIASLDGIDVRDIDGGGHDEHAEGDAEDTHEGHAHEDEDDHEDHAHEDHAHEDEEHDDHEEGDDHAEEEHAEDEHDHDGGDPHLWMDPQVVAAAVHPLADAVADATGADADAIEECADGYVDELTALDDDVAELIDGVPADQRVLVTNHDAYGYFADRYGLEIIGTILPSISTLAETNPADLNDLKDEIEATGARAIVVDAEHSSDDAEALADTIDDIEVVALYNGGLGDHDSYVDMMRSNATELAEALGG